MSELPCHQHDDDDLEDQENHCDDYDNSDYHIIDGLHICMGKFFVEFEAVMAIIALMNSILRNNQGYHNDRHQEPHGGAGSYSMQLSVEFHFVLVLEENEVPDA